MGDEDDLLTAAQKNDLAKAQAILDRNPALLRMHTPNGTLVLTATFYGAGDVVKLLLARTPEDALNLYEAATVGNARRLKTILGQSRVRVNEATKEEGFDPLGLAAFFGHAEAVKVLLDHGADVHAIRDGGHSPIDDAKEKGHAAIADLLRARGAKG